MMYKTEHFKTTFVDRIYLIRRKFWLLALTEIILQSYPCSALRIRLALWIIMIYVSQNLVETVGSFSKHNSYEHPAMQNSY